MVVITGKIRLESAQAVDAVRDALVARAERSRGDAGCISYQFARSLEDPAELLLLEEWQDEASLQAHLAIPDEAFSAALAAAPITSARVVAHESGGQRVLMER